MKWLLSFTILVFSFSATAITCVNEISGTWNFGSSPSACNVSTFQSATDVSSEYGPVIFHDSQTTAAGRDAYVSALYPVLRDTATFYLKRVKPSVSPAEQEAFLLAIYAVANQESIWTHYRLGTDGIVRFMRGDSLHGYGLMQLDDRSHATDIAAGHGTDMIENALAGLDVFYPQWVRSATAACVNSSSNYEARTRSAWAAYNGGPASLCRWTNSSSPYSAQDAAFKQRYEQETWKAMVRDLNAAAPIDVQCLAEGVRPCAADAPQAAQVNHPALDNRAPMVFLKTDLNYRFLRACASATCDSVRGALRSGAAVLVLERQENWARVQSVSDGHVGWIHSLDLSEVYP